MKQITGKALYALAFVCQLVSILIAVYASKWGLIGYYAPMLIAALGFAVLYYRAGKKQMWSYLLLHLAAYAGYTVVSTLIREGSLAVPGASSAEMLAGVFTLVIFCSTAVFPVCIAYWVFMLSKNRVQRQDR